MSQCRRCTYQVPGKSGQNCSCVWRGAQTEKLLLLWKGHSPEPKPGAASVDLQLWSKGSISSAPSTVVESSAFCRLSLSRISVSFWWLQPAVVSPETQQDTLGAGDTAAVPILPAGHWLYWLEVWVGKICCRVGRRKYMEDADNLGCHGYLSFPCCSCFGPCWPSHQPTWKTARRSAHLLLVQTNEGYPVAGEKGTCGTLRKKNDLEGVAAWQKFISSFYQKPEFLCYFTLGDLWWCMTWLLRCLLGWVCPSHKSTGKAIRWNHHCSVSRK